MAKASNQVSPDETISADDEVTATTERASGPKVQKIKNASYANMVVTGVSGKPVKFDADGVAEVGADDFAQFIACGYEEV
jgi:hypothetical protein